MNRLKQEIPYFIILFALMVLVFIRVYLITPIIVNGDSMNPTIEDNQKLVTINPNVSEINRFDIISLENPQNEGEFYVKRVIGLPGENVSHFNGRLYIDGKQFDQTFFNHDEWAMKNDAMPSQDFTLQDLFGVTTVPNDCYFVLGDNRGISKDSRLIGFVPKKNVSGIVKYSIFPFKRF